MRYRGGSRVRTVQASVKTSSRQEADLTILFIRLSETDKRYRKSQEVSRLMADAVKESGKEVS